MRDDELPSGIKTVTPAHLGDEDDTESFETAFLLWESAGRSSSSRRLRGCPLPQGVGVQVAQRKAQRGLHRRRRPARTRNEAMRDTEHRRSRRRGLGPRRRRVPLLVESRAIQGLSGHARPVREGHRRRRGWYSRPHARHLRAGLHAGWEACLRRKAADSHGLGGAFSQGGRREVRGRDPDGKPRLLPRRNTRCMRDSCGLARSATSQRFTPG